MGVIDTALGRVFLTIDIVKIDLGRSGVAVAGHGLRLDQGSAIHNGVRDGGMPDRVHVLEASIGVEMVSL